MRMMPTCREITERASAHLDGELGRMAGLGFRLHLAVCRHCRRYVAQLAEAVALVRGQPVGEPPAAELEALLVRRFRDHSLASLRASPGPEG